jgi:hypothetical protein
MMNTLAMINSCEIILEIFFVKNHCEIQACIILVCTLYSIKYGTCFVYLFSGVLYKFILV